MSHRRAPRTLRAALALVLLPAAATRAQGLPTTTPAPSGPFAVGRRAFTWVDSARRDPADGTRPREIPGWVWYPAARVDGAVPEPALDQPWNDLRAAASAQKIGAGAAELVRHLRVHAVTGAPWSDAVRRAPVLLFVPGNGWLPTDYSVLLEDLASRGYVVVGIAPTGLADVVRLGDGRVVNKVLGVGAAIGTDQAEAHRDLLHVLGRLRDLDAARGAPWAGHLDLARVGAFGHSLGGTTALVAAARDTIVKAAVNLDGDPMGDVVQVRPRQPLLFVSHELPPMSEAPPAPSAEWTRLTSEGMARSEARRSGEWAGISSQAAWARRIRIHSIRHLNFTDAALVSTAIEGPKLRWMRWGPIDGARGLRLASQLTAAFFDQALRGTPAGDALCETRCAEGELERLP
ncbi:MAG TPA: hypothetical protein VGD77_03445 [Gemmatimonadaceae bacterium]